MKVGDIFYGVNWVFLKYDPNKHSASANYSPIFAYQVTSIAPKTFTAKVVQGHAHYENFATRHSLEGDRFPTEAEARAAFAFRARERIEEHVKEVARITVALESVSD